MVTADHGNAEEMRKPDGSPMTAHTTNLVPFILVGTDAVANLIREGKCYQIPSILQSGAALGMHSLNADLARLVSTGRITREAAERCATNKSDLKNYL